MKPTGMTDLQLYLAIGVPVIANATMLLILQQSLHRQLDAAIKRLDSLPVSRLT